MKRLDTSQITDPTIRQPFSGPENKWIQDSYAEAYSAITSSMVNNQNTITVLSGCSFTKSGASYTINPGYVNYQGEAFYVPSASLTTGATCPALIANIVTSDPIGPIIFSDGNARTVYQQRQIIITTGTTGTGVSGVDFESWDQFGSWQLHYIAAGDLTIKTGTGSLGLVSGFVYYKKEKNSIEMWYNFAFEVLGTNSAIQYDTSALFTSSVLAPLQSQVLDNFNGSGADYSWLLSSPFNSDPHHIVFTYPTNIAIATGYVLNGYLSLPIDNKS